MESHTYAEYLLTHYTQIQREIRLLERRLAALQAQREAAAAPAGPHPQAGEALNVLLRQASWRHAPMSIAALEDIIRCAKVEMDGVGAAIEALEPDIRRVVEGLYVHRLTWQQVSIREYIGTNTVNRYRKAGIRMLARLLAHEHPIE